VTSKGQSDQYGVMKAVCEE